MADPTSRLEERIDRLTREMEELRFRLDRLEERGPAAPERGEGSPPDSPGHAPVPGSPAAEASSPGRALALVGRFLIILGGAFLLRALTDVGTLPRGPGTLLGMIYAFFWLGLAERSGLRGDRAGAAAHGLVAAVIAYPLLGEGVVRYGFLSQILATLGITATALAGMTVAWRHRLLSLAWIAAGGGTLTLLALSLATRTLLPGLFAQVSLGLASLAFLYGGRSRLLPGVLAAIADGMAVLAAGVVLLGAAAAEPSGTSPEMVRLALLLLFAGYLTVFGIRSILTGRDVSFLEIGQAAAVTVIGLGGAATLDRVLELEPALLVLVSGAAAAGTYGITFSLFDRSRSSRKNFRFYSTLALVLTLFTGSLSLQVIHRVAAFSGLAVLLAVLATRLSRVTLNVHSALYAATGTIACSAAGGGMRGLLGAPTELGVWLEPLKGVSLAAVAICLALPAAVHGRTWGPLARGPKTLLVLTLWLGLAGILLSVVARVLRGEDGVLDAGVFGASRTTLIALSAVGAAGLGRWDRLAAGAWLTYPFLALGGLSLGLGDLLQGRPATVFVSLGSLGAALILAPRILRTRSTRNQALEVGTNPDL